MDMARLQYHEYGDIDQKDRQSLWYGQAVRVDNCIACADQGLLDMSRSENIR